MKTKLDFKKVGTFFKNAYHKIGKKNLIVIAAILVIGGAVYVNYLLFSDPVGTIGYGTNNMSDVYGSSDSGSENPGEVVNMDEYFSSTVLSRQKARDEGAGSFADRSRQRRSIAGNQGAGFFGYVSDCERHRA